MNRLRRRLLGAAAIAAISTQAGTSARAGCWMARDATRLDPLPYEDGSNASLPPAACVSWLR